MAEQGRPAKNSELWDREYRQHNIASSFKLTLSRSVTFLKDFLEKNGGRLSGLEILDCGCGNGRNAIPLAEMGNIVWGMDISEEALNDVRKKVRERHDLVGKIQLLCASMAEPWHFPDNSFDIVADITSFDILLSPEEIETHQREVRRVLKPDGYFLYYDMDATDPYALWLKSEGRVRPDGAIISPEPTPIPFRIYSLEEVQALFGNFDLLASQVFRFRDLMFGREHDRAILAAIFQPKGKTAR